MAKNARIYPYARGNYIYAPEKQALRYPRFLRNFAKINIFIIMFLVSFLMRRKLGADYSHSATSVNDRAFLDSEACRSTCAAANSTD